MKIAIGSDHAGFKLKEKLKEYLKKKGHVVKDFGAYSEASVDYPAIAIPLARAVAAKKQSKGILLCGSGVGVTIAANRIKGIRAVNAYDLYTARQSREHGDSNILCLGGRVLPLRKATAILEAWLSTSFSGDERHARRIKLLDKIPAVSKKNKKKTAKK
jgi:ribose 5-phosphate isomerase B